MTKPDPRALRSRAKILDAVREILFAEGPEAVTHQHVAKVAGVGRATVYRHWKSAEEMIYALLDENPFRLLDADHDAPLEDRLSRWLTWVTTLLSDPLRRSVILHVLSRTESDARANRLRTIRTSDLMSHLDAALGETHGWSQLSDLRKVDGVLLLMGPLLMQITFLSSAPSPERINESIQRFLAWLQVQSPDDTTNE